MLALYFVQGMPYGFQVTALPIYLRSQGVSLVKIGLLGLLALPWMLKALWAPLVDRYGSRRFGRRRSWIVPMQAGLAATCAVAAFVSPQEHLPVVLGLIFLMNLFAATQDIAVDGLAVDLLKSSELGMGNAAQVVGYKLGMLAGGGLLAAATVWIGWNGLFGAMSALAACVLAVSLLYREPSAEQASAEPSLRLADVLRAVLGAVRLPGTGRGLALVATYKMGETMVDVMFKPYLADAGFTVAQVGLWLGTYGTVASLAGSVMGGALASRTSPLRALGWTALLRALPLVGIWLLGATRPSATSVIALTCAEHFFASALTTAMFAFMMSKVDPRIGATHYTLLASVEVLGKGLAGWTSGFLGESLGYSGVFGLGVLLSLAFLLLVVRPARSSTLVSTQ